MKETAGPTVEERKETARILDLEAETSPRIMTLQRDPIKDNPVFLVHLKAPFFHAPMDVALELEVDLE